MDQFLLKDMYALFKKVLLKKGDDDDDDDDDETKA